MVGLEYETSSLVFEAGNIFNISLFLNGAGGTLVFASQMLGKHVNLQILINQPKLIEPVSGCSLIKFQLKKITLLMLRYPWHETTSESWWILFLKP